LPTVQLTDLVARTAKPVAGRQVTYWDRTLPNFGLRIGEHTKTWTVMLGAQRRRLSIGHYPAMSLQGARIEARRLLLAATVARQEGLGAVVPFSEVLDTFVQVHVAAKRASTAKDWERVLRKYFAPAWTSRLMPDITRADVAGIVNTLLKNSGEANNAFAVARLFFRWSVRRGYLARSPMEQLALPIRYEARDRVLARGELGSVARRRQSRSAVWDHRVPAAADRPTAGGHRRVTIGVDRSGQSAAHAAQAHHQEPTGPCFAAHAVCHEVAADARGAAVSGARPS